MIIPAILPGEIDRSYFGRVMRINGVRKEKVCYEHMALHCGLSGKSRREVSFIRLLSEIAGLDTEIFAQLHTTLPYRRGITSYYPELEHGSKDNQAMLWTTGIRIARPGAYCCHKCIKRDLKQHGVSYWHREHQIPGVFTCPTHGVPLMYIDDQKGFLAPPDILTGMLIALPDDWVKEISQNPYIKKFQDISICLLNSQKPVNVNALMPVIKQQALALGFQSHPGKIKGKLISDAVIDHFGRKWLATVIPTLADKKKGIMLKQQDGVLFMNNSSSGVAAYILALSVLYDSSSKATKIIADASSKRLRKSTRVQQRIETAAVKAAYIESKGSYSKTASLLQSSYQAISQKLKSLGLPNIKIEYLPGLEKAAYAFFKEEKSLTDSANLGSIPVCMLEDLIRMASSETLKMLMGMRKPLAGRGSGSRRAVKLAPHEIESTSGKMATKFSPHIRAEQLKAMQSINYV
jgi:hypothetical protein